MVVAILILSLLLCGCSSQTEERLISAQSGLFAQSMSFHVQVHTLSDNALWEFAGDVRASGEDGELTLTLPEEIRNVTVSWGESMELRFDGMVLVLPSLGEEQSPVSALPLLIRVLQKGWLLRYSESGGTITACYGLDQGMELWVSYDEELCPLAAELYENGERRLWMEISNFIFETE